MQRWEHAVLPRVPGASAPLKAESILPTWTGSILEAHEVINRFGSWSVSLSSRILRSRIPLTIGISSVHLGLLYLPVGPMDLVFRLPQHRDFLVAVHSVCVASGRALHVCLDHRKLSHMYIVRVDSGWRSSSVLRNN